MIAPDIVSAAEDARALADLNRWLSHQDAEARVEWMLDTLPGTHVLSSSFGAQAAASLHLVTSRRREVPVVLIDTGYLFPETYRFADALTHIGQIAYLRRLAGAPVRGENYFRAEIRAGATGADQPAPVREFD